MEVILDQRCVGCHKLQPVNGGYHYPGYGEGPHEWREITVMFCPVYWNPMRKWDLGGCFFNAKRKAVEETKINPLKAGKRKPKKK